MTTKTADVDAEVQRRIREKLVREEAERVERIRSEVLAEQEQQRKADERQASIADIRKRIPVELDRAPLEEAIAVFRAGAETLIAACAAHDARHTDLWTAITGLASSGTLPADLVAAHTYGGLISADGKDYRKSRVQHTMATVLYEVFRQYYAREQYDIGKPQD